MSTVIMFFVLPIGILIFWWDRKNLAQSFEIFRDYIVKMQRTDFDDAHRMEHIDAMFYENGYQTASRKPTTLTVEKKHFNIGLLFIFFGLMNYFGIFVYIILYRFILKPHRLCVDLSSETPLSKC
jgi:hypothetical protein